VQTGQAGDRQRPQDRHDRDRDQQGAEHVGEQAGGSQRGDQHVTADPLAAGGGRIGLAPARAEQAVEADELKAAGA
jgi:hypothetical protein